MNNKNSANKFVLPDFTASPRIDKVGVEERVAKFQKRSIKLPQKTKMG